VGGKLLIVDYANNPHKISSIMHMMKKRPDICYIFQPHGFGPTRLMKDEYIDVFVRNLRNQDHLILLPIYYAGGSTASDISSSVLSDGISKAGRSVELVEDRDELLKRLDGFSTYVVFGARDETLSELAGRVAEKLKKQAKK
jgi:UDP-N-acetylmuramate--alanine ligase